MKKNEKILLRKDIILTKKKISKQLNTIIPNANNLSESDLKKILTMPELTRGQQAILNNYTANKP